MADTPTQQSTPEPSNMRGWATLADGSRVALSEAECREIWEQADAAKAKRAEAMPDEASALRAMHDAHTRLTELGWREAIYCPKDGSPFDVIEAGGTGVHRAYYEGEWPTGRWWITSPDGDQWPSRPILFRLDPEAEAARKAKMAEAAARFHAEGSANGK